MSIYLKGELQKMTKIDFKAKIWDKNGSFVITVPKAYVKNNQIESYKSYNIAISECEEGGQ